MIACCCVVAPAASRTYKPAASRESKQVLRDERCFWKSGSSWLPTLLAKGWNVHSDRRRVRLQYICQALVVRILHLVVGVVLRWFATKPRPRPRRAHDLCRDKLRWLRVKCEQRTAAKAAPLNAYRRKVYEAIAAGVAGYVWYPSLSGLSASQKTSGAGNVEFIQPMLTRRSRFICRHACCGSGCAEVARVVRLATVCLARNQKHTFIESGWRGVVSIYADLAHGY